MVNRTSGIISTIAGTGANASNGDGTFVNILTCSKGGLAVNASIGMCWSATLDKSKNAIYLACAHHVIRFVNRTTNIISTFAGTGVAGIVENGKQSILLVIHKVYLPQVQH